MVGGQMFTVGQKYHRQSQLHDKYGGNRQSGIASCSVHPIVFLFSSPRGEEFGYKDGWISANEYLYTGEGQYGDMSLVRGNRAIYDHKKNNKDLHLFKQFGAGYYEYLGCFEYISHETNISEDGDGRQRNAIVFRLRRLN
jgi:5-methylcytosine-specific restriction protein A